MKADFLKSIFSLLIVFCISSHCSAQNKLAATAADSTVPAPAVTPVLSATGSDHTVPQSTVQPKLAASDQTKPETAQPENNPAIQPKKD